MGEELEYVEVPGSGGRKVRWRGGYRQLPIDSGMYVQVERVVEGGEVERLAGHIVTLDLLNEEGTEVVIKKYRGDGVVVLVNGREVYKWKKMKGGTSKVTAPRRAGAAGSPGRVRKSAAKAAPRASTSSGRRSVARKRTVEVVDDDEFE